MSESGQAATMEPSRRSREIGIRPPGTVQANGDESGGRHRSTEIAEGELEVVRADSCGLSRTPGWQDRFLRVCDVVIATFALVLLSPILLAIAVAIKLDSDGTVLYRQLRIGVDRRQGRVDKEGGRRTHDLGGRPFLMYKFRTMRVDAERESGPVWARREDERVTRVGRFLREHRLDELPQFWNVLKGDMSIVGPRPERPSLVNYLRREIDAYQTRQRVRPGITGWAQINRDSDQTVDDVRSKLRYDLEYLEERSIAFDFRIMARTVPVMLEREVLDENAADSSGDDPETGRKTHDSVGSFSKTTGT